MRRHSKISITRTQTVALVEICEMLIDQVSKFLRHDDWDCDLTKKQADRLKWPERKANKMILILKKKLERSKK